jgi:hypothetical protein
MPHFCAAISLSEAPKRYVTTSLFEHITKAESQRSPLCSSKLCSRFVFDVTLFRRINLTFSRKVLTFRSGYSVKDSSSPDKTSPYLPYLRRNLIFARKDITLPAAMGPKVLFVMCKSSKASLPQVPAFESVVVTIFPGITFQSPHWYSSCVKRRKCVLRKEINEEDFSVAIVVVLFVFFGDRNEKNLPKAKPRSPREK